MTDKLTNSELRRVASLSGDERYDYFVEKIVEWGEVWSLYSDDGWVGVTSQDGEECLPVWPHRDFAAEWVSGEWADCTPTAISLEVWVERWIPGMEKDGTLLAVFPNGEGEGVVVTPDELLASIEACC